MTATRSEAVIMQRRYEAHSDAEVVRYWEVRVTRHPRYQQHAFRADVRFGRVGGLEQTLAIDPITAEALDELLGSVEQRGFVLVADRIFEASPDVTSGTPLGPWLDFAELGSELLDIPVHGAVKYDWHHLSRSEYGSSATGHVGLLGVSYEVLHRSERRSDWATATLQGLAPPPKRDSVAVSRTGIAALEVLRGGRLIPTKAGVVLVLSGEIAAALAWDAESRIGSVGTAVATGVGESPLSPIAMAVVLGWLGTVAPSELLVDKEQGLEGWLLQASVGADWESAMRVPGLGLRANHAQYCALQRLYRNGVHLWFGGIPDLSSVTPATRRLLGLRVPLNVASRSVAFVDLED